MNLYIILGILLVIILLIIGFIISSKFLPKKTTPNEDKSFQKSDTDEELSNNNLVDNILDLIGGINNISTFESCKTRLKFDLIDPSKASFENDDYVNKDIAGMIKRSNTQIDVIVGHEASLIAKQIQDKKSI